VPELPAILVGAQRLRHGSVRLRGRGSDGDMVASGAAGEGVGAELGETVGTAGVSDEGTYAELGEVIGDGGADARLGAGVGRAAGTASPLACSARILSARKVSRARRGPRPSPEGAAAGGSDALPMASRALSFV
jgi:hypothetical protein